MNSRNQIAGVELKSFYSQFLVIGLGTVLLAGSAFASTPLTGEQIMVKNEEVRKVDDIHAKANLETGGKTSTPRLKKFEWWKKLTQDQVYYHSLSRFHAPAEIRGEGILFLEKDDSQNEILMYLPNFKKIRRVETQAQSKSFMGSEFSYSDMATPHAAEHTHKLLKQEPCGETDSVSCFVVESIPANEAVRERTGYSKSVAKVRSDNFMVIQAEYWNLKNELFKKLTASELAQVDSKKNKWMALKMRVENLQTEHFTELKFEGVKVNQGISDSVFTRTHLSRVH